MKDFKVIIANDEFRRVTEETFVAQLNYSKGQSTVTSSEMRQDDIKSYQTFLENAQVDPKVVLKSINITGFSSPEGEEDKNNSLSTDRAATGKTSAMKVAKNANNETATGEIYKETGSGEDYDGFKNALSADNIMDEDDKNLVLRVLETISSPAEREKAMRDMGKTFSYLDKNIFPQLRRTEVVAVYDQTGFSDEELMDLSTSNPDTLNLEELLFTASIYTDLNEKLRVYKIAITDNKIVSNNVGAVRHVSNGKSSDEIKSLFESSNTDESKYNLGLIQIEEGKYEESITSMGETKSYNFVLANILAEHYDDATDALEGMTNAKSYYLKAIIGSRTANTEMLKVLEDTI